jgi:ribosomal protein S18 acetylase RimI-like enzyme
LSEPVISFLEADKTWSSRIAAFSQWGENAARHLHFEDGFCLAALASQRLIGYLSAYWKSLPAPLDSDCEAYIDILEVDPAFKRRGIASRLINLAAGRAAEHGALQLRSWSSLDKHEAILMWRRLGFGICPAATYPQGQEVRGFFVTLQLEPRAREQGETASAELGNYN